MNENSGVLNSGGAGAKPKWARLAKAGFLLGPWLVLVLLCCISPNAAGQMMWLLGRAPGDSARPEMETSYLVLPAAAKIRDALNRQSPLSSPLPSPFQSPLLSPGEAGGHTDTADVDRLVASVLPRAGQLPPNGFSEQLIQRVAAESPCLALQLVANIPPDRIQPVMLGQGRAFQDALMGRLARQAMLAEPDNAFPVVWAFFVEQREILLDDRPISLPRVRTPGNAFALPPQPRRLVRNVRLSSSLERCRYWLKLAASKPRYDDHFEEFVHRAGGYWEGRRAVTLETISQVPESLRGYAGPLDHGFNPEHLITAAQKLEGPREAMDLRISIVKLAVLEMVGHHPLQTEIGAPLRLRQASNNITTFRQPSNFSAPYLYDAGWTLGLLGKWVELTGDPMLKRNYEYLVASPQAGKTVSAMPLLPNGTIAGSEKSEASTRWLGMVFFCLLPLVLFWVSCTPLMFREPWGSGTKIQPGSLLAGFFLWWAPAFLAFQCLKYFRADWVSMVMAAMSVGLFGAAAGLFSKWLDFLTKQSPWRHESASLGERGGKYRLVELLVKWPELLLLVALILGLPLLVGLCQWKLMPAWEASGVTPLLLWLKQPVFDQNAVWFGSSATQLLHWQALLWAGGLGAAYLSLASWSYRLGFRGPSSEARERYAVLRSWWSWLGHMLVVGAWTIVVLLGLMMPLEKSVRRSLAVMATPMDVTGKVLTGGEDK